MSGSGLRAVLLIDHGSHDDRANANLDAVARLLAERIPDDLVRVAHMELASPGIAEAVDACVHLGVREIVVVPYFLAAGQHAGSDIPRLVREAARNHSGLEVRIAEPLGAHPRLVDVLLDRMLEAR